MKSSSGDVAMYFVFFTVRSLAERGIAKASCLSISPSVSQSVTLRYSYHIGLNSAKIISRLISLTSNVSETVEDRAKVTMKLYTYKV